MKDNKYRLTLQANSEINDMINILRDKHTINISAFIRKAIIDLYNKMEK